MIKIHEASARGLTKNQWLTSYHSFSFGDYYDPSNRGYGSLRVINDDYIAAGAGFDPHPHRDMEIITYMISGALEHKDSMGNHFIIKTGDVQRMSAGSGITHSEHNHSATEPARLLQLWFHPAAKNIDPSYEQKSFSSNSKTNKLKLLVSPNAEDDSIKVNQDLKIYCSILEANQQLQYQIENQRQIWLQVVEGTISCDTELLTTGDGALIKDQEQINLSGEGEFLLFDFK